jgi:hypothetical protein
MPGAVEHGYLLLAAGRPGNVNLTAFSSIDDRSTMK